MATDGSLCSKVIALGHLPLIRERVECFEDLHEPKGEAGQPRCLTARTAAMPALARVQLGSDLITQGVEGAASIIGGDGVAEVAHRRPFLE
jgi:hypothetical protein